MPSPIWEIPDSSQKYGGRIINWGTHMSSPIAPIAAPSLPKVVLKPPLELEMVHYVDGTDLSSQLFGVVDSTDDFILAVHLANKSPVTAHPLR